MELRHLRYFVAVAEAENVSRAALKLHVSQPALSRQVKDLEEELGFPLLERGAKSVRLTEAGRVFLNEARAVLQRAEEAVTTARAASERSLIELHVGYAPSPTVRILPLTLRAFQAELPEVRVKLHDQTTEELLAGVREERLHIAFLVRPTRAMLRGVVFEALSEDPMRLAVPPTHRFARMRSVPLAQIAEEPLVALTRKDYPEYHVYLEALFANLPVRPKVVQELDSGMSFVAAIEAGSGVALAPESLACSAGPRLKLLPVTPSPAPIIIGAAWLKGHLTSEAERFLKTAKGVIAAR
jgi:DNA-binding transcriptional LysR family regulator